MRMRGKRDLQPLEMSREPHGVDTLEEVASDVRVRNAVRQHEADAGQRLEVIVDDPPFAVGAARQISRVEAQRAGLIEDPLARAEERVVGEYEFRRHEPLPHQVLRPVEIREQVVEQSRALHQRRLEPAPLGAGEHDRHQVELPLLRRRIGIGEHVVGDARLAHPAFDPCRARRQFRSREFADAREKAAPARAHRATRIEQLIVAAAAAVLVHVDQRRSALLDGGRHVHHRTRTSFCAPQLTSRRPRHAIGQDRSSVPRKSPRSHAATVGWQIARTM